LHHGNRKTCQTTKTTKTKEKIMKTNSNSKCKMLLCLALPLSLTAGYASDASPPAAAATFIDAPAPIVQPVSASQAADSALNYEIFRMVLADSDINYNLAASVNEGVVTLGVTSSDGIERQRVVNEIWELRGVNQVTDASGVITPQAPAEKAIAVR